MEEQGHAKNCESTSEFQHHVTCDSITTIYDTPKQTN